MPFCYTAQRLIQDDPDAASVQSFVQPCNCCESKCPRWQSLIRSPSSRGNRSSVRDGLHRSTAPRDQRTSERQQHATNQF